MTIMEILMSYQTGTRTGLKRNTLKKYLRSDRMEIADETYHGCTIGEPFYYHSSRCEGGCDYACSSNGFEVAQDCAAMEYSDYNS